MRGFGEYSKLSPRQRLFFIWLLAALGIVWSLHKTFSTTSTNPANLYHCNIEFEPNFEFESSLWDTPSESTQTDTTFCLGVHVSEEKLYLLDQIFERWPGKIFLAILTKNKSKFFFNNRTTIQYVYQHHYPSFPYPANALRQRMLEAATEHNCEFFLHIDSDFLPSKGFYSMLQNHYGFLSHYSREWIFAFASQHLFENATTIPATKSELNACIANNECYNYMSLLQTDISKWQKSNEPYAIISQRNRDDNYEPYVLIRTSCSPGFDQRLLRIGGDKVSWNYVLLCWGAKYMVLPDEFLVHRYHEDYKWKSQRKPSEMGPNPNWHVFLRDDKGVPPEGCYSRF